MVWINIINPKDFKEYGLEKEIERIAKQLKKHRVSYSKTKNISKLFGSKYPHLLDNGFLDVTTTRYNKRENKTIFALAPDNIILPAIFKNNNIFKFKRLRF